MGIQEFLKTVRHGWLIIAVTTLVAVFGAFTITQVTTPLYKASTRLYVSSSAGQSMSDLYQGNRLSQERVASYTELLTGSTLAQRTIDRLGLDMTAEQLQKRVKAVAKRDTVLINVSVLDKSAVQARDIANTLSEEFVQMAKELETPTPNASPDARVVLEQRAAVPSKPVIPKTGQYLAAGLFLGLLAGVGLALLRDRLDNTVKDRETIESIAGVSLVGSIPIDKRLKEQPTSIFEQNSSAVAEAYRKLRTNMQFLAVDNPPRLIVVTSSEPNEGKTTTSLNLALALAEAEHSVVVIDGDMRRPSMAKILNAVEAVGLSSVLSGGATLTEALQETRFPRMAFLAAGPAPPNPSELLGSLAAKKILTELRERFDYVVIDSPPLLAFTDGAVLAAESDGVLLISRFGRTRRGNLDLAARHLADVGASILGTVLTMTPTRKQPGYYYGYYYSYGSEDGGSGRRSRTRK